jgi:hypothetical protein
MRITYIVKQRFQYGGRTYEKGETWEPAGGKFDKQIIESGKQVFAVNVPENLLPDPETELEQEEVEPEEEVEVEKPHPKRRKSNA